MAAGKPEYREISDAENLVSYVHPLYRTDYSLYFICVESVCTLCAKGRPLWLCAVGRMSGRLACIGTCFCQWIYFEIGDPTQKEKGICRGRNCVGGSGVRNGETIIL